VSLSNNTGIQGRNAKTNAATKQWEFGSSSYFFPCTTPLAHMVQTSVPSTLLAAQHNDVKTHSATAQVGTAGVYGVKLVAPAKARDAQLKFEQKIK
jgi:hypothetical protein